MRPPRRPEIPADHYDTPAKNMMAAYAYANNVNIEGNTPQDEQLRRMVELVKSTAVLQEEASARNSRLELQPARRE